ncbi:uncharacterized protein LOC113560097 [Rhopalosiphum maidis]|uniref:uncharacterized protein LOC113560097 n=1 Tax=Rhopalosiphum maidis TaxID=43146 RepID=UPI000EFF13F3|nr:uncharacterized protein LOC113560097 [Rhopalosiphum maidis]
MIENPLSENIKQETQNSLNGNLCSPLGLRVPFEVAIIQAAKKLFGCTYLERNTSISPAPILNLWLERPVIIGKHGHCKNVNNMDHFLFECVSKRAPTRNDEIDKGWNYIILLDHTNYNSNKSYNNLVFRCAVYDVHDGRAEGVKIIRMAISAPSRGQFDESQCQGLSKTMGKYDLPRIPEGRRTWPDGSMYLYLVGKPPRDEPPKKKGEIVKSSRPTTTTKPIITSSDKKNAITTITTTTTTTEMPEDVNFYVGQPPEW